MKNIIASIILIWAVTISANAQFTSVKVHLQGQCMSANSNTRYAIRVEINNITTGLPAITPVLAQYTTEGFPLSGIVTIPINATVCEPDGNSDIYQVVVSAVKFLVPNGPSECQGKAVDQPEFNCYGIIYTLPTYPDPSGIVVDLN